MKASKDHKMDRKRKHKALAVAKTEKSRKRRLDNKAKRDEIHAIDPNMKIVVINQRIYDKYGTEIEVVDGKINAVLPEIIETTDKVIEKIETRNKSAIQRLTEKMRDVSL